MFDIGFAELLLVAVIGLLVLGPERLPEAIRTGALWIGRLRRSFNDIKADLEREVGADDIRRQLRNESIMGDLNEAKQQINDFKNDIQKVDKELQDTAKLETKVPDQVEENLQQDISEKHQQE